MKCMFDWKQDPHRRFNPLSGEWVLVSPHRTARPWLGQVEPTAAPAQPEYDPTCYLCPGNPRAGGVRNPHYTSTFVFDNDFAALKPDTPPDRFDRDGLLVAQGEPGICRVVCFSPKHNLTIANMDLPDLRRVVDVWVEQYADLGSRPFIRYVQIFENRGAMMGASNPHPHCQIWSNHTIPNEPAKEQRALEAWHAQHGSCLLCDYARLERASGERVVEQNESFLLVVPFWAVWPFETLVLSNRHLTAMDQLSGAERDALADILRLITSRYDRLFQVSFPYSMGFHQRPTDGASHEAWHFHAHFLPAASPFRDRPEIPGRLRDARLPPARHHPRSGGRASAPSLAMPNANLSGAAESHTSRSFKHLFEQLPHLFSCLRQCLTAPGRCYIDLSFVVVDQPLLGSQPSAPLHAVKQWIHRPWPETVAVPAQFANNAKAENRRFRRMVQHVQTDQSDVKLLIPLLARSFFCHSGAHGPT